LEEIMTLNKRALTALGLLLIGTMLPVACSDTAQTPAEPVFECQLPSGSESPEFLKVIGCDGDFQALASEPVTVDLPGARSTKVVLDQADSNALYFQDSVKYQIHYEFVSTHLSGKGLPLVPDLASFNTTEYYTPDRRFILGAVSYYEGPKVWALEVSPYDTASAAMITLLHQKIAQNAFFGKKLYFHPTSDAVSRRRNWVRTSRSLRRMSFTLQSIINRCPSPQQLVDYVSSRRRTSIRRI
jgi:hypothetical protein